MIWIGYTWLIGCIFFLGYGRASHDFARVSHGRVIRQAFLWPAYMVLRGFQYWRWHQDDQ